jgi:tRNA dimethylallyltransferase
MAASDPPLIAIVGPTAAGKSGVALRVARAFGGEIVSCDSLQVYRGLDVGSAKPTRADRDAVPHHLIDVVDPDRDFSAAEYARLARAALADIAGRGRLCVVVGGTGLYLRALVEGLFEGPSRHPVLRERLRALGVRRGDARLHRLLARLDPEAASKISPADRVRVVRALEVRFASGRPISEHHRQGSRPLTGFRILTAGLSPDRASLRLAVLRRTDEMLTAGLLEETKALLARGYASDLRPLRAIGYRQAVDVLEGRSSLRDARNEIVRETMRYAKRQMTWFRRQAQVDWFPSTEAAFTAVEAWLTGGEAGPGGRPVLDVSNEGR